MWLHENKVIEKLGDFPENTYGFIYVVTHIPSKMSYVGKKVLYHNLTKKLTKKELAEQSGPGRKSVTKKIQKESQGQKIKFMDYDLDAAIQITELHIRTHKARVKEFNDFINKS